MESSFCMARLFPSHFRCTLYYGQLPKKESKQAPISPHNLSTLRSLSYFRGVHDMHKTACVFATGVGLTNILTNTVKVYVGYLRPIFYDVCDPDETYQYCTSGQDNAARVSFPSGHSSLAFCGLGLLAFYLEQCFGLSKLQEWRRDPNSGQWRGAQTRPIRMERILSVLCFTPFLVAIFIASSRIVDNKHFPADVVGGSILGASIARFVHGIWFSSYH
jgi:diacylglycerol diphosphate phosphatase / phosphatidate phosphatase